MWRGIWSVLERSEARMSVSKRYFHGEGSVSRGVLGTSVKLSGLIRPSSGPTKFMRRIA